MIRQKKFASALAGVSFIAIAAASTPAFAGGKTVPGPGNSLGSWSVLGNTTPSERDFITINNGFIVSGDVNIDTSVGGGTGVQNDHGFYLDTGAEVTGNVNIYSGKTVDANVTLVNANPGSDTGTSLAAVLVDDGAQVDGSIVNNGSVDATAKVNSGQDGDAEAYGIITLSDKNPYIQNNSSVTVDAVATAYDTSLAVAGGIGEVATSATGPNSSAYVYNAGTVNVTASAHSVNGNHDSSTNDNAIALAFGAGQLVTGGNAYATLINSNAINVGASAYASGIGTQDAWAAGGGVAQVAGGQFTATTLTTNDGQIDVVTKATAHSTNADGSALSVALGVTQISGALDSDATATLTNADYIHVHSYAEASGGSAYGANANSVAAGAVQVAATVGGNANATISNELGATIEAYGSAQAYGVDSLAQSYVIGAGQIVLSGFRSAVADVTNDGRIATYAHSYSVGTLAYAEADSGAVKQVAINLVGESYDTLSNTDMIDAHATATAHGIYGIAHAGATGVVQLAAGLGPVNDKVTNSGTIFAGASSYSGAEEAIARADAHGVDQYALTATDANFTATNHHYITASAHALAEGEYAAAQAYATGIFQGSITLDLANLGLPPSITGVLGGTHPELPVSLFGPASATVNNDGVVNAYAEANAIGYYNVYATAVAIGVDQEFLVLAGDTYATINNDGGSIFATAHAHAAGDDTSVRASATATGADQYVNSPGYGNASITLDNTGVIDAYATAYASGYTDVHANALAKGVEQNSVTATFGDASSVLTNSGQIFATATAYAVAYDGYPAYAEAHATGVDQGALAYQAGTATVSLTNTGGAYDEGIYAFAKGSASSTSANAHGTGVAIGVYQEASANYDELASATLTNDGGKIIATGVAYAYASDNAYAEAGGYGVSQYATSYGEATGTIDNSGTIAGNAFAEATASDYAYAHADASGIYQEVTSHLGPATATITNSGIVAGFASALSWSYDSDAGGQAYAYGVNQSASNDTNQTASATLTNTSDGLIQSTAQAWVWAGDGAAYATAEAFGVAQDASANYGEANITLTNDGTIEALAFATASNYDSSAAITGKAFAQATGVDQSAVSDRGSATSTLTNTSKLSIHGDAFASAYATYAYATAVADGAYQNATAYDEASVNATNSGLIAAHAVATASGFDVGQAHASATGLEQNVAGLIASNAMLDNSGSISATATAHATAEFNVDAKAEAFGHYVGSYDSTDSYAVLTLDVTNSQSGSIVAHAYADGFTGEALAAGAWYAGNGYLADQGPGGLEGTIINNGLISAAAYVNAATGYAEAFGVVEVSSEGNNTSLTNTGIISAFAEGPYAQATAIAIGSYQAQGAPVITPAGILGNTVVENDGGVIYAGEIAYGSFLAVKPLGAPFGDGQDIYRGNAINTRGFQTIDSTYGAEPNPVEIDFTGGAAGSAGKPIVTAYDLVSDDVQETFYGKASYGYVFGNIQLTEDDTVNVMDGVTIFDGLFNSDGKNNGALNIQSGGTLVLVQNTVEGAAGGYVHDLNISSTGTLAVELTPSQTPGDYPQLDTVNASLDGTLKVIYDAGFYANSGVYEKVITGENVTGEFANVTDNQVLLDTIATYHYDTHVDIEYKRVAFNAGPGQTTNQRNVGGAIENVYPDLPNGGTPAFNDLVAHMFTLDAAAYANELDQLSGSQYANHLQSVLWSTRAIDRVITDRMECAADTTHEKTASNGDAKVGNNTITPTADIISSTGCYRPGEANIWMSGFGQWNKLSGDNNAPGYDETQYGILFGADYAFTDSLFFGIAGGYFNSKGSFDNWGGASGASIDYDGLNLAAYGGYDNSTYYLRGIVAYGNYSGNATRHLALDAPNTEYSNLKGSPDSNTWSFYGETGYRFDLSSVGQITPFLGLSIATANLDSFTEKDPSLSGAALNVHSSNANSVASVLGARFTADMAMGSGIFSPVLSVAWMHEFDSTRQEVNMSFAGAPAGASFKAVGSNVGRDSAVVDAGAKFQFPDALDVGLYYNGQFNADYTSNGVTATLGYKF